MGIVVFRAIVYTKLTETTKFKLVHLMAVTLTYSIIK